ncbi:putative capsid decoration protein [Synechococcus sp. SYN20]|uniref:hypothetical protein n=1 Tax=Synechococcus sp. SYN20 TaxID=1050714 RepID=UPI0016479327|nr:hypothetical protein [Synechococcus sp. SYN20]QNJ25977.1 putative capsid decoration protein [Synechococcus sp. SYN20]
MASFKVSQFTGVTDTTADSLLLLAYTADNGATYSTRKIRVQDLLDDLAQDSDLTSLLTLQGVPAGSADLGSFTGDTIAEGATIKEALQALESSLELQQGALTAGNGVELDAQGNISLKIATGGFLEFSSDELSVKTLDEDDFVSNSDSHLPTQQSVKAYVDTQISTLGSVSEGAYVKKDGSVAFEGDQSMGGFELTNLAIPTQDSSAATKQYVDLAVQGLDLKESVRAATTVELALVGEQVVDGVSLTAGDRVLVKSQTDASENGIYVVDAGAWTRAEDADGNPDGEVTSGMFTFVEEGTVNGQNGFSLSTANPILVGATDLTFVQFSGAGQITAGNGISITGNEISVAPAVLSDISDLASLTGVSGSSDLGTFAGDTIADSSTIKEALQSLETLAEAVASNIATNDTELADHESRIAANELNIASIDGINTAQSTRISDLQDALGAADGVQDMGSFTGATITDNGSVRDALQELETALEQLALDSGSGSAVAANLAEITALRSAQGTANGDINLGTFTGGTISDNASVKTALSELEAAVEAGAGNYVSKGANVTELVAGTVAETEPANYLFMVVDQADGSIKVLDKTFIETEESA